jgi:hypothetical protein
MLEEIFCNELLYGAKDLLKFKATEIFSIVFAVVEPVGTYIILDVLVKPDPVAINEIPFILIDCVDAEEVNENEAVASGLNISAKLALVSYINLYSNTGKGFDDETCGLKILEEVYCNPPNHGFLLLTTK